MTTRWEIARGVACLGILAILIGCYGGGGSTPPPAPKEPTPQPPAQAESSVEPPGDPDIEMGQSGWTLNGNAPISANGTVVGSAFMGTVQGISVKLSSETSPIAVSSFSVSFPTGTLTGSGAVGSSISWNFGGTALTACTDSCNAVTLPSTILTPSLGSSVNFSYTPVGSTTATTVPFASLQKIKVFFQ
jgi:hypothetical protein